MKNPKNCLILPSDIHDFNEPAIALWASEFKTEATCKRDIKSVAKTFPNISFGIYKCIEEIVYENKKIIKL